MRTGFETLPALALVSLALVACGSSGGTDTTLPTVISVTPVNGTKGVTADASIVFTFSKPMDQASTQAAYQSGDLPASGVAFSWNSGSTVMTVKPTSPLIYTKSNTLTQAAKSYAFSLTGNATDKAGNRLPLTSSAFSTLRDITATLPVIVDLSAGGSQKGNFYDYMGTPSIKVGDSAANENLRGYLTFDLSSLPADVVVASVSASIHLTKDYTQGHPFTALNDCIPSKTVTCASPYTTMNLEHVAFGEIRSPSVLYNTPLLHDLGSVATYQSGDDLTASVMVGVQDDLANRTARENRSQYRLRFPLATNNDNLADMVSVYLKDALHAPYLNVEYQIP